MFIPDNVRHEDDALFKCTTFWSTNLAQLILSQFGQNYVGQPNNSRQSDKFKGQKAEQ